MELNQSVARDDMATAPAIPWTLHTWEHADEAIAVPFPVVDRAIVRQAAPAGLETAFLTAPVARVDLAGLVATQAGVSRASVAAWATEPDLLGYGRYRAPRRGLAGPPDWPWVFRWRGQTYIYEGHHRLSAATYRGAPGVWCRLLNLDG